MHEIGEMCIQFNGVRPVVKIADEFVTKIIMMFTLFAHCSITLRAIFARLHLICIIFVDKTRLKLRKIIYLNGTLSNIRQIDRRSRISSSLKLLPLLYLAGGSLPTRNK